MIATYICMQQDYIFNHIAPSCRRHVNKFKEIAAAAREKFRQLTIGSHILGQLLILQMCWKPPAYNEEIQAHSYLTNVSTQPRAVTPTSRIPNLLV